MPSHRISCPIRPSSFLLLLFCHQILPLFAVEQPDVTRTAADSSSSINTEEDLGGLNTEWLTDAQLSELTSAGNTEERMKKLRDFYDNLEGEAKKGATKKIMGECYGWVDEVATEDERNALKQMHHQSHDECRAKVRELMGRLSEERREQVEKRMGFCEHVYYGKMEHGEEGGSGTAGDEHHHHHHHEHSKRWAHRQRRDHHHGEHGLEDYFKTHLAWMTDEQKAEIRGMKQSGKSRSEIKQKVIEWYEATSGDAREKAAELLKGGCRELIKIVLGEEKANKIKEMKESGTEVAKISEQVNAWIDELADAKKKELANEYWGVCARVFGMKAGGRKRRSWHGRRHNLQQRNHLQEEEEEGEVRLEDEEERRAEENFEVEGEHLQHHNSWLSQKQKQMLKKLRDRGHEEHELHERIHQFYDVSPEEVKATARGILQRGCESILKRIFGEYKAEEIIQMRNEGATNGEIEEKFSEALNQIRNPQKREEAGRFAMSCSRIFAMIERRRRAADNAEHSHSLEGLIKSHLIWLNEQQKEELKQLEASGGARSEMQQKVMGWFELLEGQEKQTARGHLQDGCREILAQVLGKEKADHLRQLKEGGMSWTELEAKVNEMVDQIQEEEKKSKAGEFGKACKKIMLDGAEPSAS